MPNTALVNRLAVRIGNSASRRFVDTVTFKRPSNTADAVGGVTTTLANTTPTTVPCRYRPASGSERSVGDKVISGNAYMIFVPAQYSSSLIDVDAKCQAVIASRTSGEPSRTFHIHAIERYEGVEIAILATLEE